MSEISEKALNLIDTFEVRRARDLDINVLKSIKGPVVDGKEQNQIINIFNSDLYLKDDQNGYLASFVVLSPQNTPLIFFSLRCGELFETLSVERMEIGYNAYVALHKLTNYTENLSYEERSEAMAAVQRANKTGLSIDDWESLYYKKSSWIKDDKLEYKKEITKVLNSFPAVELKLFGINYAAKEYWNSLGLPENVKMGETLFWLKVVKTIETITRSVGCQYLYLFAADKDAEGQLVQYYRVRLGFISDAKISTNKPRFDWQSQFLFQSIDTLFENKNKFIVDVSNLD